MKVTLSQDEVTNLAAANAQTETLEKAIAGCKLGDWEAKHDLERQFASLIAMLAEKRVGDDHKARNFLMERGREGLYRAAKKFPKNGQVRQFRIFAIDHIETAMDKPKGFLARLFG